MPHDDGKGNDGNDGNTCHTCTLLALKDVQLKTKAGHTWSFNDELNADITRTLEIDAYYCY